MIQAGHFACLIAPESDSAQGEQDKFAALRDKNADFGEIERTGLASGAKDEDIRMAGELSSVLGKKIRFFSEDAKNGTINNGEYHEDTGEIWINARSRNVKAQIVAHELTHSIEKKDSYQQLVDLTMNKLEEEQKAKGKTLDDLYREKETLYADGGVFCGETIKNKTSPNGRLIHTYSFLCITM